MSNRIEGSSHYPFPRAPEDPLAGARQLNKNIGERTVGLLLKLLGDTESDRTLTQTRLAAQSAATLPPMIRAYDRYARKLEIPRESWKQTILEPAFKQNASNPEALYRLIVQALAEGFVEESVTPAQQLVKVDPNSLRAAALLGAVLLQQKRFDEALKVLESATEQHGEEGYVLMRIARAYAGLGRVAGSEEILWRALMLDPNQEDGLEWYAAIGMEREGKSGRLAAYRRIAALPGSWLAQLSLARVALEEQDLDGAVSFYKEILQKLPGIPADVLLQISGDLAKRGELRQMLELCGPRFDAAKHGLLVGANLIAAHIELKDTHAARQILEILYALQRPDWREHLAFWQKRIDEADYGPMKHPKSLAFELLRLGNPIWAYGDPDIEALLPSKAPDACRIVLVCGSGSFGASLSEQIEVQPADALGRLTRFFPMFFAEELQLLTEAQSIFLLPWIASGGFVLSARPWRCEQLKIKELDAAFVVMMHVDAHREPWMLQFSLLGGAGGLILDVWEQPVDIGNPASAAVAGLRRVLQTLCLLDRQTVAEDLAAPEGAQLTSYLTAIERALALSTDTSTVTSAATMENAGDTLQAERSIFDHLLLLAADTPRNARTRCLLVSSLYRQAKRRPDLVREYWQKLQHLQSEHPLQAGPASAAVTAAIERLRNELKLRPR